MYRKGSPSHCLTKSYSQGRESEHSQCAHSVCSQCPSDRGISGMLLFMLWNGIFDIKLDGLRSIDNPFCAKILKYKQRKIC